MTPNRAKRSWMSLTPGFLSGLVHYQVMPLSFRCAREHLLELQGFLSVRLVQLASRGRRADAEVVVEIDALA